MTYSLDLRQTVMDYNAQKGLTFAQTRHHFAVGMRTLFRWHKALSLDRHRQQPATRIDLDALQADVQNSPDDYQWVRAKRFGVRPSSLYYGLKRLAVSDKKTTQVPQGSYTI